MGDPQKTLPPPKKGGLGAGVAQSVSLGERTKCGPELPRLRSFWGGELLRDPEFGEVWWWDRLGYPGGSFGVKGEPLGLGGLFRIKGDPLG